MKVRPNSGAGLSLMSGLRTADHSVPYLLFALWFPPEGSRQTAPGITSLRAEGELCARWNPEALIGRIHPEPPPWLPWEALQEGDRVLLIKGDSGKELAEPQSQQGTVGCGQHGSPYTFCVSAG